MEERAQASPRAPSNAPEETAGELAEIVRSELAVARSEVDRALRDVRERSRNRALATVVSLLGIDFLLGALVVRRRRASVALALLGCGLLGAGLTLGAVTRASRPSSIERTRWRVVDDLDGLELRPS